MMTKTNRKYTYQDLIIKKQVLKKELNGLEQAMTFENVPKSLALITQGVAKNTPLGAATKHNLIKLALATGAGYLLNKTIFKSAKKNVFIDKTLSLASAYVLPYVVDIAKNFIIKKILNRKKK